MQTLVTARLVLEPLVAAHADALFPVLADARMAEFLDHPPPASLDALRERCRRLESRRSSDGREQWLNWALLPREGGSGAIGCVQASVLEDHSAWVAYEVASARWGQGLGSEATHAMVEHLGAHYGVLRCMATVDQRNERSWRLLERLGFRRASAAEADGLDVQAGDHLYLRPSGHRSP
jgi:[ribosomal protein S5]-alanine N-acetyltransferase